MKVNIKTGDNVIVNSGKDAGKKGKVLKVIRGKDSVRVIVEGVNVVTKAKKARTAQDKSELVKQEAAIDISNVNIVCPDCGKPVRIGHVIENGKKFRVCSKCGKKLDSKYVAANAKTKSTKSEKTEETKTAAVAEKKTETAKKSKGNRSDVAESKATKVAAAKKPTTSRSSQRGV